MLQHRAVAAVIDQERTEFIAAEARHDVRRPDRCTQNCGHVGDQLVPDVMARFVVDPFQAVHVEKGQQASTSATARDPQGLLGQQVETTPVRQAGQIVGAGKAVDLLVGQFQRGGAFADPLFQSSLTATFSIAIDVESASACSSDTSRAVGSCSSAQ